MKMKKDLRKTKNSKRFHKNELKDTIQTRYECIDKTEVISLLFILNR